MMQYELSDPKWILITCFKIKQTHAFNRDECCVCVCIKEAGMDLL